MRLAAPLLSPEISLLVLFIDVGCTANQLRIPIGLFSASWKLSWTILVSTSEAYLQGKHPSLFYNQTTAMDYLPGTFFIWICIVADWVSVYASLLLNLCIHQEDPSRVKDIEREKLLFCCTFLGPRIREPS